MPNVAKQIYTYKHLKEYFDQYDHFYVGSNNCPLLTIEFKDYKKILKKAKNKKLTFLVPPLPQNLFGDLNSFLEIAEESKAKKLEIVFNDWGTYNYLKSSNFKLITGPWFASQKKDPLYSFLGDHDKTCKMSNYNNPLFRQFFQEHGIDTIELENVKQGIFIDDIKHLKINCYYPWVTFSITRHCPFAAYSSNAKHRDIINKCNKECQKLKQLEYQNNTYKSVYKGNAQLYFNNELAVEQFNLVIDNSIIAQE